jgi:hypothetical protein
VKIPREKFERSSISRIMRETCMKCVVCDDASRRTGSLTCCDKHAATLRQWQHRSRRKKTIFDAAIAKKCDGCGEPLLVDVDNGQVRYHVHCAKVAKKIVHERAAISRSKA